MKVLMTAFFLLFSTLSFSQVNGSGVISIGNGQTTIGITVGNNTPNQDQLVQRMLRLERAVRDLQNQVYHLSMSDMPQTTLFECRIDAFGKIYRGEGDTRNVAKSNARKSCEAERNSMFCGDEDMNCDQLR